MVRGMEGGVEARVAGRLPVQRTGVWRRCENICRFAGVAELGAVADDGGGGLAWPSSDIG